MSKTAKVKLVEDAWSPGHHVIEVDLTKLSREKAEVVKDAVESVIDYIYGNEINLEDRYFKTDAALKAVKGES